MTDGPYHACGFLFHPESQRVLLHHRDASASAMPNRWSFFCGGPEAVDHGDPVLTWRREIQEEIGVALETEQIQQLDEYVDPRYGRRRYVFVAEWANLATAFALGEGDGIGWFSFDEAFGLPDLPDIAKDDLRRFVRERGLFPS